MSDILVSEQSAPGADGSGRPSGRLLEVDDLRVEFRTRDGVAKVINGVTYHVDAGETLAVLGESGSGKSVTAQTIMGILDTPPGFVTGGQVRFHGKDMLKHVRRGAAADPWRGHRDDLPGLALRAQPGLHRRVPDRRAVPHPARA